MEQLIVKVIPTSNLLHDHAQIVQSLVPRKEQHHQSLLQHRVVYHGNVIDVHLRTRCETDLVGCVDTRMCGVKALPALVVAAAVVVVQMEVPIVATKPFVVIAMMKIRMK